MDLKTLLAIVRGRFLAPTLVVSILSLGAMAFLWNEYKVLQKEKDVVAADRKTLYDERVAFEKLRADAAASQATHELDLQRREYVAQQVQQQLNEAATLSQKRSEEQNAAAEQLRVSATAVSQAERTRDAENKLQRLMAEFSELGVDLDDTPCDGDQASKRKFNAAKSKFNEAFALAEANGLEKKYRMFFFHNGTSLIHVC